MSKESKPIRSRRERRRAQSSSNQASAGGGNPSVPLLSAPEPSTYLPAVPESAEPTPDEAKDARAQAAGRRPRRATDAPLDAPGSVVESERSSQARARDKAALRAYMERAQTPTIHSAALPSRRALRLARLEAEYPPATNAAPMVPGPAASPAGPGTLPVESALATTRVADTEPMGGEEALTAREALTQDAQQHLDHLPAAVSVDPLAVDLEIMVQQRAIAERAGVLNRRVQVSERLVQENAKSLPPVNDPAAAHNLAMVTPLEFVRVPGIDMPVMRPPTTSHIPVISPLVHKRQQGPAPEPARTSPIPGAAPQDAAATQKIPARNTTTAARTGTPFEAAEMPPLPAGSAHGLEPLDAVTAGLGRLQRNRLMLWGAVAIGGVALIAGFTMIITGLAR